MGEGPGQHDVFKLVSLRGPVEGLTIDPSEDVGILIVDELEASGARLPLLPTDVARLVAPALVLDDAELRALPWAALPGALSARDGWVLHALRGTVTPDSTEIAVADYAASDDFLRDYTRLATSWLSLQLRRSAIASDNDLQPAALLSTHEKLVRVAHVLRRIVRRPDDRIDASLVARLANAEVILPRALRERGRARSTPTESPAVAPRKKRRDAIAEAKRAFARLEVRLEELESIQTTVHAALAEWANISDKPLVLDASYYAVLERRLSPSARSLLSELVGDDPAGRPRSVGELVGTFDSRKDVRTANSLCSLIRLYEDELKTKLPSAREPQGDDRPSVRALGWGDLVVVREKLVGYAAHEIAHIENVLAGEEKAREHERSRTTEDIRETETTTQTESERDLQTSERFELQVETQKTLGTEFSVEAGINTSGRYGLTRVETSLDAGFQRSVQESQQRSSSLAKEVVARSIEKVQESVRDLRRRVTIEEVRELSRHTIDNRSVTTEGAPSHRVGLYYWVEKIHELELRQYGTRLMVEFHIPEPGVTLLEEGRTPRVDVRKPADLAFGPQDISAANFMCLTKLYGAQDVEPPPPLFKQVGFAWASEVLNSTDATDAEDTVAKMVKIPDGYAPANGRVVVTGRGQSNSDDADLIHAQVSVGGHKVLDSGSQLHATYVACFEIPEHQVVENEGLPISARIAGHDDRTATVNVIVACRRTLEAYQRWQLRTYEHIREAHAFLVRQYDEAREEASFQDATLIQVSGRPAAYNRQIEREELRKWAIKTLRIDPFDFDAIVDEAGIQEIDPIASDEQAPLVRFFEESFEWRQMSYILYPYFWGRRSAWSVRNNVRVDNDPQYEAFLRAGAARVVVPITPGYEDRVLQYLESDPALPDGERIPPPADEPPANTEFPDLWLELLLNRKEELALGDGTRATR